MITSSSRMIKLCALRWYFDTKVNPNKLQRESTPSVDIDVKLIHLTMKLRFVNSNFSTVLTRGLV
jgi:hypothetical protein